MSNLDNLNPEQREAAMHTEGPLLILAGAGSGKTSTMTQRIAYLVKEKGVEPRAILAVTFTNKAAGEMRDRVEALLGGPVPMWIMTFHAACLRMLRQDAGVLGYSSDFTVYDPVDQKSVVKSIIKEHQLDDKKFPVQMLLSVISDNKEQEMDPDDYIASMGRDYKSEIIYKVYKEYQRILKKNNAMDFDDLLLNAVRMFDADEAILEKYRRRFQYIMVDEYQDTNRIQYRFIKMLAEQHHNLCVVGDDDQCIYQWRGADITNILNFEKDFKGTKVVKLEENYRSTGNILNAAHSVISNNKQRKDKKLWTKQEAGDKIVYNRADDEKDEARYIAQEIDRLKSTQRRYNDFAVLYRTNAQSRTFEEALSARDIPYRVVGGTRYYERKEIKDMMAYLRLVLNPDDDLALVRIINEPKRGIGNVTVEKLQTLARVRETSLFRVLQDKEVIESLSTKACAAVNDLADVLSHYHQEKENLRISDMYNGLLTGSGYLTSLEQASTVEADSRIENLMEFKSVIYDFEDQTAGSLTEFLEKISLMSDIDNHNANENAVVLMTLHSAKGLEFPIVFMPGMEDGLFPGWRSMERDGIEEERRLCYVGMTRAKERLFLTGAAYRTLYGKSDYTRESQFLRELDPKLIEGDGVYRKAADIRLGEKAVLDGYAKQTPFRPFDRLEMSMRDTHIQAGPKETFVKGDRVNHGKFGPGLVLESSGNIVTVMFDREGRKKLAADIAPLNKLKE
jgi:DNA helicase II / ATP-dependent DNA helicase PcrA